MSRGPAIRGCVVRVGQAVELCMDKINRPNRVGLANYLNTHAHLGGIIVSQKYRFIYMKSCRTGGTSILRRTLEKMPLDTFHFKDDRERFLAWLGKITDDQLTDYQIFSFVRNPCDRAVSIASYFGLRLEDFVLNHKQLIASDRNLMQHSIPCYRYTHHAGKPFVDMVGRFEKIQTDFHAICHTIGFHPPHRLPHANASNRQGYRDYFEPETFAELCSIYRKDIELFRYDY